ncbi:MAG: OB-fold domain-containing protein [Deltaproteobacteria bacterium]|nr:OB-fold domain-containing protein [Deltaproteobacteria bacterium]
MTGISSYGGYVPRYRLDRKLIFNAMGWMNAGNGALSRGEKAVANFDEDSITMAVAAGVDALAGMDRAAVSGVYFASTTMPYKERLNAGIIAGALALREDVRAADFTGGLKAGTSALLAALDGVQAKAVENVLVCASDCRLAKPAAPQELIFGDAAAALVVGDRDVIAEFKGSYSITADFVDHFRGANAKYDRQWEDRWIRDVGYERLIPQVVRGFLEKYGLKISDFAKVVYPCHYAPARKSINRMLGIAPEAEQANLLAEIGEAGTAQSLVMFVNALETAKPGDKLLLVSFGSGCDALAFEVTGAIEKQRDRNGIAGSLAKKAALDNYTKYLVWRDVLPAEGGLRSEEDLWTRFSALWRAQKFVSGLWGGKCRQCGTPQLPAQRVCVEPSCGALDQMEDLLFSDKVGYVATYTGDNLAPSYNPPAIYGAVNFEGGGKFYFDFTDCNLEELSTGMPVRMSFRRKYYDKLRDISGYFWKAVPVKEAK